MKNLIFIVTYLSMLFSTNAATDSIVTGSQHEEQVIKEKLNNYLWDAARNANNKIIHTVISEKYNLNVQDSAGYTAVMLSAYHGHYETVKILLDNGADPCIRDNRGNTALMGAIFKGEIKISKLLISAKCNPDQQNNTGQTAAMYASLFQRTEILKDLQNKGADMKVSDAMGNTVQSLDQGNVKGY